MAISSRTIRLRAAAESGVHAETLADLLQLSTVAALSAIGVCLSLVVLTLTDNGEWLTAVMNGF